MAISKSDVNRFAPGTAEYIVVHGLWRASRGRKLSATLSWLKNPTEALEWAKRFAYFPDSGSYLEGKVPEYYVCGECGASGVKLWREYQTFLDHQSLRCLICACREQDKVRTPTEDGCSLYTDKVHHWYRTATTRPGWWNGYDPKDGPPPDAIETRTERDKTDQIGWRVPAVPTEEGNTYWGYTSVPTSGINWWCKLPTLSVNKTS
ncbi:MAG: hypothetical protein A2675_01240 [Candidatus Yonathbacteria bacterium RIFCSPHIGHO2_01_FULL_51_10]|uniref:Uncharacterized protein n=1 Tax=Candidatus Yonathbacteria bacterium RIFCSPHIGHO2_01_FULL_51_10 TaxID=1802723 RepID=A0A1G2S6N8_9BACT|nr:MAG: hypothetical protein A2675_01240 [Candidatus Yonathbacteria bacterium RIFCSPHIGHO2_01_FULL_51_10]